MQSRNISVSVAQFYCRKEKSSQLRKCWEQTKNLRGKTGHGNLNIGCTYMRIFICFCLAWGFVVVVVELHYYLFWILIIGCRLWERTSHGWQPFIIRLIDYLCKALRSYTLLSFTLDHTTWPEAGKPINLTSSHLLLKKLHYYFII